VSCVLYTKAVAHLPVRYSLAFLLSPMPAMFGKVSMLFGV